MVIVAYGLALNTGNLLSATGTRSLHTGDQDDESGAVVDECGFEFVEVEDTSSDACVGSQAPVSAIES